MTAGETLRQRSPLRFYLLVFDLSIPFWLAGAVADRLPVLPAIGEEGGWMGDAADPLQARWGAWIAWKCLETLAARVLNVGVSLFPNDGSHYDPAVAGVITAVAAGVALGGMGRRRGAAR